MNTEPKNLLAVTVRYIGPTNHRGSRIKLSLPRFDESLMIPYDYECNNADDGAIKFLASKDLHPIAQAEGSDHAILLFSFDSCKPLLSLFRK